MDPLLMTAVTMFLVLIAVVCSFFGAVAVWILANLIYDEIKQALNEDRPTRAQKKLEDAAFDAFIEDLYRDYNNRPINVFRDGVSLV